MTMRALFGLILLVAAVPTAFAQSETVFDDGFERLNEFVDVAAAPGYLCAIDVAGDLRCTEPPDTAHLPDLVASDYIDLAGTEFGVCARTASGTIDCFGEAPLAPDAAFEAAIAGTSGFLPDLPASLCAPDAAGSTVICFGQAPPAGIDVLDVAASDFSGDGDAFCWAPVGGGIDCTVEGAPVSVGTGQVFTDIAVGGDRFQSSVCGLTGTGVPLCFDLSTGGPDPIRGPAVEPLRSVHANESGSYCGLDDDDRMACWLTESAGVVGNTISQNRASSSDLASIESFFSTTIACGIDRARKIDCWGALFAGAGLPPPGVGWTGVASTGAGTSWAHPARPGWTAGFSADQQRAATDFETTSFSGLADALSRCGVRNGEFRCIEGTDRWDVPPGPWRDVAVSFSDAAAWCGVRDTGALVCESRIAGSQLAAVPAGSYRQVALAYDWFNPMPQERAIALAEDGTLTCWGTSGPCSVPPGSDFVQLSDFIVGDQVALRTNGEIVSVSSGAVQSGEAFERYRGLIGFRSDGTIGWWNDPSRPVPPGSYLDVVAISAITLGPGSEQTTVDGCGIRSDGGLECWVENAGVADLVISLPGNYRQVHNATGLQLTDAGGRNQTFMLRDFGNALEPAPELASNFSEQCMIDGSGRIGCKGVNSNDLSPVNQTVGTYRGLTLETEIVCAIDALDRVDCWSLGGSLAPVLPDEAFDQVVAGAGHACARRFDGSSVVCAGNNPFNSLPAEPFPTLIGDVYGDLATSAFKTCVILPDGSVDCFEAFGDDTAPPPSPAGYRQLELSPFSLQACLIDKDDRLECFRPRDGDVWPSFFAPAGRYQDVAISATSICALTIDGQPRCWGIEATLAEWNTDGPRI